MLPWPSDHIAVFCARFLSSECCSQVLLTKFHTHSLHNCYYQSPLVLPCLRGSAKEYTRRIERNEPSGAQCHECVAGRGEARRNGWRGHARLLESPDLSAIHHLHHVLSILVALRVSLRSNYTCFVWRASRRLGLERRWKPVLCSRLRFCNLSPPTIRNAKLCSHKR
jgi:hypothetical protein